MEHHSNIVPWQMLCEERGATLKRHPDHRCRRAADRCLPALLTRRRRLMAITHVSNALGTINPVKEIVRHGP